MSDVFLLGAGFSKAVSASMPLLKGLSRELKERLDLPEHLLKLGDNAELWLTYLSQPHPWLSEPANLRNRAQFLESSQHISNILGENIRVALQHDCPDWLNTLVQWWHDKQSNVITLNYDTLVERAAGRIDVGNNEKLDIDNIYPVAIPDVRRTSVWALKRMKSLKLFKLHGSVNWHYSGTTTYYGETLYSSYVAPWDSQTSSSIEEESIEAAADKVPLIVPQRLKKLLISSMRPSGAHGHWRGRH